VCCGGFLASDENFKKLKMVKKRRAREQESKRRECKD
jgi:hypothetical protein